MGKETCKAIMAGMAISLGCCLYLLAPNPIIGSILFSCGLLSVRIYKLHLFTGKIQCMATDEYNWVYYTVIFLANIVGVVSMWWFTRTLTATAAAPIAQAKASQPFLIAYAKALGCGMLMSLATYKESPLWMCLICVPAFILAGFNHCIADAYYALAGGTIGWGFPATVLGNICGGIMFSNLWDRSDVIT